MVSTRSFFSISYDLILKNAPLSYDLYVNSSSIQDKQKFIRLFPSGEILEAFDLEELRKKYHQLYVPEDQRKAYMNSLVNSQEVADEEAVDFIKETAIEYLHKVFDEDKEFSTELLSETIHGCRDAVESMIDVLDDYNIDSLRGLIGNLSGHDFYTYDHSINVAMYCITIVRALKKDASRAELMHAGLGGLLHDLGKIKIPTHILNNPSGLSDREYEEIKKHPDFGIDLLLSGAGGIEDGIDVKTIGRVIHEHHENWDGTGYPNKVKEHDIHLLARVCAIADFFDAVTTKRSYNKVLSVGQALEIMGKTSGKKLDPTVFKVFAAHVKHSKVKSPKELKMADHFDPSIPYEELPIEEVEKMFENEDFGKIRVIAQEEEKAEKAKNKVKSKK
ncbi:MAG: HD domain-containing protein [Bacteriovoracaceae bacterium]|nr:HD domain-containing protein [Bacteriovoracaceae bacterium]